MKKNIIQVFVVFIFLMSACAGSQTHLKMLEDGGAVKSELSDDPDYDFKVFIRNTVDFGWDGGKRADRQKTVDTMYANKCAEVIILDEKSIDTGTYAFGKPAVTWMMKIKCKK